MMRSKDRRSAGKRLAPPETFQLRNYDLEAPVFCLRDVDEPYCITQCNSEQISSFVQSMRSLSQVTWRQILLTGKTSKFGSEKLPQTAIDRPKPAHLTADQSLLAIRFWEKCRMVGYRERDIFRIIWFDRDYSLYNHG